jgi:hypothetical protein
MCLVVIESEIWLRIYCAPKSEISMQNGTNNFRNGIRSLGEAEGKMQLTDET